MSDQSSYCTFRVGSIRLGVEVKCVQEVIREQVMTRIPGANDVVRGLMNLRGQIVTALDLQKRLGLDQIEEETNDPKMNVVVRTDDGPVSFLVHEIGDVLVVNGSEFESPPETLPATYRDLISGAYKLDTGLLLVLDTEAALSLAA